MFESPAALLVYFALKYAAYASWMYLGIQLFASRGGVPRALMLGLLRVVMGLAFGFLIYLGSTAVAIAAHDAGLAPQVVAYLGVYVPVRWIEWGIMEVILRPSASPAHLLLDIDWIGRKWRCGGIVISCLADLVLFADVGGLPIGRFMC